MQARELFSWPDSLPFSEFFPLDQPPWQWISFIAQALCAFDFQKKKTKIDIPRGVYIEDNVWLDASVRLPHYACIEGPSWIGPGTQIRPGAYIRGNVIVGANSILGHSCEYKNCLLMDYVKTAHFNYIGDSILGNQVHLGAGVILANLRLDEEEVSIRHSSGRIRSNLKKLGAMIGDGSKIGCQTVCQPGTILEKNTVIMHYDN